MQSWYEGKDNEGVTNCMAGRLRLTLLVVAVGAATERNSFFLCLVSLLLIVFQILGFNSLEERRIQRQVDCLIERS